MRLQGMSFALYVYSFCPGQISVAVLTDRREILRVSDVSSPFLMAISLRDSKYQVKEEV